MTSNPVTSPHQPGLRATFRDLMAGVCTPVTVITGMSGDLPHGTTVSAFASLSMSPPMVMVALDRNSELLAVVRRTRRFGVNVLSSDQMVLALAFARKGGTAKFNGVDWEMDAAVPRIPGAGGFAGCRVAEFVDGGDHVVLLGEVLTAQAARSRPLTYHARAFGTHVPLGAGRADEVHRVGS
jgi:flavin reductase (DIM6/NTAB) family NADH-FMN oxidoreductase RutF